MSDNRISEIKRERAELMAEQYLLSIGAKTFRVTGTDNPLFDFIVAFNGSDHGLALVAVELRITEKQIGDTYTFKVHPRHLNSLKLANVPVMFRIANVKYNEIFCGLAHTMAARESTKSSAAKWLDCTIDVIKADGNNDKALWDKIIKNPDKSINPKS